MSSEEDFSLVDIQKPPENTLEGVKASISNYKKKYEQLVQEQKELAARRDDLRDLAEQFRQRTKKLTLGLREDELAYEDQLEKEKATVNQLMQEEAELMEEIRKAEAALEEEDARNKLLKEQADVFTAVPERAVVFSGATAKVDATQKFDMDARIVYPMEGGTALITFEEEEVAKKILSMREHKVDLGAECNITVKARPVKLMVPSLVEIDSKVCPQRILISNLPRMDAEILTNKLEIHFSKRKHGGGEVEECEMMPDSWTVVITFVEKDVAKGLTDTEYHEVKLQDKMHRVRVTPFLNGNITNLKTEMKVCPRTVMLTGIPDVMEHETLQDLLEIHFQKTSNSGGEIEAFLYNPLGQDASALFDTVSQNVGEEEEE
uniref:interferon-induced protein 35 n=1 Tax=Scatophagus argus TaxID=75038 RepID=UPI001ED85FD4|nr:interferon-induced protein 35 [Scatophagus argus]